MFSFRETAGPFHIMFVLFYTPTVMVHESSSCSIILPTLSTVVFFTSAILVHM